MNARTTMLWVPGLISLTAAMTLLTILREVGLHPLVVRVGTMPVLLYVPWLVTLPLIGAASAYLSRKAGARVPLCLVAGMFPAIVLFGSVTLGLAGMALHSQLDRPRWLYVLITFVNWAVLPGAPLFFGTLPFLIPRKHCA